MSNRQRIQGLSFNGWWSRSGAAETLLMSPSYTAQLAWSLGYEQGVAAVREAVKLERLNQKEARTLNVNIDGVRYVPEPEQPKDKGLLAALEVRFSSDAGDDLTVREYLRTLLMTLWEEGEGFSGKRPFGNSGWEYNIYNPLVKAGLLPGTIDDDGDVTVENERHAHAYVCDLILAMCHGVRAANG